jgi:hypothetical protein
MNFSGKSQFQLVAKPLQRGQRGFSTPSTMLPGTLRVTQILPGQTHHPYQKRHSSPGATAFGKAQPRTVIGSMLDMESLLAGEREAEKSVFANERVSRLSTFSRAIVNWRWNGYTWREIAGELDMDHTAVRRAYLRELESLLQALSRSGDS